jgi:hypothetical protein
MELSTSKTKILACCRKHICELPAFIVNDQNISVCDKAKFLGVYFDSKLLGEDKSIKAGTKETRR